jgi:hypothetical protein
MTTEHWIIVGTSVIGAVGVIVAAYFAAKSRMPTRADTLTTYQGLLSKEVDERKKIAQETADLRCDVRSLRSQQESNIEGIKKLERVVRNYKAGVHKLIRQLREHNITPAWSPSPADDE